ncbi:LysR family transcriptional regulator [Burkholderia diffusa]|uniref:LysR family transcriptional regulator n=1 Tax=Burkholderia diffusa TaxID=488732 RepID=UPI00157A504B|nr:LysR family transcriptional regulator [Burkholderia diffusa]NTY41507.1 LysR family transcriptional regulator [Burkholderia diffusa]
MELKWLEDFLSVAKLRNFSQAAGARHATQPALSRRVKALEVWYGVPLIDRSTYPVTLTSAGSNFLPMAEQIVADLYRSRREARAEFGAIGRALHFAMPHSLAVSFFPGWWRRQPQHGDLTARVVAADFDGCVEMLLGGACQFLLCYRHEAVPLGLEAHGVHGVRIGRDRLVPVSARDANKRVLFDLADGKHTVTPLLAYPRTSFLGRITSMLHARLEAYAQVSLRYESALVEALKAEALLGEGVAWLPETMINSELRSGALQVVGDESLIAPLSICLCRPTAPGAVANDPASRIWSDAAAGDDVAAPLG